MTRHHPLLGEGARCSVLLTKLRPSGDVQAAFPNRLATQRLEDLVAVRHEQITRRGLTYEAVFFTSESITGGIELSAASRFVVVKEQGPQVGLWDTPASDSPASGASPAQVVGVVGTSISIPIAIDDAIFNSSRSRDEDIAMVRNQGFDVDDDGEPVPKNIPSPDAPLPVSNGLYEGQTWGWDGIDRRANNGGYKEPSFTNSWTRGHPLARATSTSFSTPSHSSGSRMSSFQRRLG